jgi:hypothetical protein
MATDIPPRFADFGKAVKELITNGFGVDHVFKFESKARPEKDLKFTAEYTQLQDGSLAKGKAGIEWAHKCNGTLKVNVGTDNVKTVDVSYKELVKGLTLGVVGTEGSKKSPNTVSGNVRYTRQYVDAEAKVDLYVHNKDSEKPVAYTGEFAVAAGARGAFIGAKAVVALTGDEEKKVRETDVVATYKAKEFEVNAGSKNQFKSFDAGYIHHVNDTLDVGAQVTHTLAVNKDDKVVTPTSTIVAFGASFKYDDATVKTRINSEGELSGAFTAPVSGGVSLTLTGRVNTLDTARGHAVGLQVALK